MFSKFIPNVIQKLVFGAALMLFCESNLRGSSLEMSEFVWGVGMASTCDKGVISSPKDFMKSILYLKTYRNIHSGNVVWVRSNFVKRFYREVFPRIRDPFVLMISGADNSFPSESGLLQSQIDALIMSEKVIHIFAQNCDDLTKCPKMTHLPIGVDYHSIAYKSMATTWGESGSPLQQEARLKELLQTLAPTNQRIKKAFVDFQHFDTIRLGGCQRYLQLGEDRTSIFERLLPTGLIDYGARMKRLELWKTKGRYAFSISPHGNGLDCHRTWEDLILGCIVIVKTSPLDPMYEGLPVVIVQDWSEVTEDNMTRWIQQYGDAFTNPEYRKKLTNAYWLNKVRAASASYLQ